MAQEMLKTMQYYWNAARVIGSNLGRVPTFRWRFETFLGKEATNLTATSSFTSLGSTATTWSGLWIGPRKDNDTSAVATLEVRTNPFDKFD